MQPFQPGDLVQLPDTLVLIIEKCLAVNEAERPSITTISKSLRFLNRGINIVDDVVARFQSYSAQLEAMVASRTHELLAETYKVESLLKEMIPRYDKISDTLPPTNAHQ